MNVKPQTNANEVTGDVCAAASDAAVKEEQGESLASFAFFLVKLVLAVLIFRSFIFSPFSIPSESMLPRLWNGDYLVAAKWPYGFSKNSLPYSAPLIPGRVLANQPEAGDVVIFKHPVDGTDYIKRVVALPGDSVAMVDGQVILNGEPVAKERIEDFVIPVSENTGCAWGAEERLNSVGESECVYAQFRETLPNGVSFNVLDFGPTSSDNMAAVIVPEGRLFVMGDNRDNSQDSRFPAVAGGGVGLVPQDNLVGRASAVLWSTDGSANWFLPWTWFSAARWGRMGDGI